MLIKNFVKDITTEKDGVSFCPVRAGFIVGFICIIAFTLYDMHTNDTFDFLSHAKEWMSGLAEYLGLGGAAVAGKNFTEKSEEPQ